MSLSPDPSGHRARLRERWRQSGPAGFPDYELLELLLTQAVPRRDTKPMAKDLLRRFGTLKGVLDATAAELESVPRVGPAVSFFFSILRGTMERYFESAARKTDLLNSPEAVIRYCRASLEGLKNEVFDVIFVSTKNRVLGRERLSEGTIDQAAVYPRRVVSSALAANAASLIFVHNHPSGDPTPSPEDKQLTRRLEEAAQTVGIPVLDHLIVGNGGHFSFREQGLLA